MQSMLPSSQRLNPSARPPLEVKLRELKKAEHGSVLCYPGNDLSSFSNRISQLKEMGVSSLIFDGESRIGNLAIIGKGCVSVVVKARNRRDIFALKIRRSDANRPSMTRDYELQKLANSFGVGPKALNANKDFFLMEFIDSVKIGQWFRTLRTRTPKKYVRALIRKCLYQCYLLDSLGLDHGELSNPSKHVLIRKSGETLTSDCVVIDYESASLERKPSNLTSAAQFFFFGNSQSQKVQTILDLPKSKAKMVSLLREYKQQSTLSAFENIMRYARCWELPPKRTAV